MTIRQTISNLRAKNLEDRLSKLTEIGAPKIVLENTEKALQEAKSGNIKVNGLERKHKVGDEPVIELYQEETTGYYYNEGKQKTLVLKMVTAVGTYYYDYRENKIGSKQEELSATVSDNKFERVH